MNIGEKHIGETQVGIAGGNLCTCEPPPERAWGDLQVNLKKSQLQNARGGPKWVWEQAEHEKNTPLVEHTAILHCMGNC